MKTCFSTEKTKENKKESGNFLFNLFFLGGWGGGRGDLLDYNFW